ncbi:MAG: energy-coupling factor ABC transporter substrate-binding protein [Methanosarcinaceae archaeon]|nr:energy-coupling factor ABC transporter substrate-binding protein [Methanosarcinaceae archaeon]
MNWKLTLILLTLLALLSQPVCLAEEEVEEEEAWGGADGLAADKITEIAPDYEPWFSPIWEPPSGEIESLLFSTQAAIGALIIGYFFGYNKAKKQEQKK